MNLSGDETFNLSSSSENNFIHNSTPPIDNNGEKIFLIKDINRMEMDSIKDIHPKAESVIRTNVRSDNVTTIKPSNFVSYFSKKREYFFFILTENSIKLKKKK